MVADRIVSVDVNVEVSIAAVDDDGGAADDVGYCVVGSAVVSVNTGVALGVACDVIAGSCMVVSSFTIMFGRATVESLSWPFSHSISMLNRLAYVALATLRLADTAYGSRSCRLLIPMYL